MSGVLEQRYAKWSGLKFNIYIYICIFDPKQNEFVCIVGAWK